MHSRAFQRILRGALTREGPKSRAAVLVRDLQDKSPEFEIVWEAHEVGVVRNDFKRIVHPEVGILELHCQMLQDFDQSQALLVFTAIPGSDSYGKLQLLSVIGDQRISPRLVPARARSNRLGAGAAWSLPDLPRLVEEAAATGHRRISAEERCRQVLSRELRNMALD